MHTKLVTICVVALFAVFQLGHSLQCYHCWNKASCSNKTQNVVTCNEAQVNITQKHIGLTNVTDFFKEPSSSFACLSDNIAFVRGRTLVLYEGCVFNNKNPCEPTEKAMAHFRKQFGREFRNICNFCTEDKCNSDESVFA